ncbi:MAG: ABC transporter permease subunit [Haloarculaceae archaeon]
MLETTRFEAERLLLSSAVIAIGLAAFGGMMTLLAPGILGDIDLGALLEQLPPVLVEGFDLGKMGTIEGFVALELYQFVWVLGLGAYLAYSAAGTVAGDVEDGRMDTLLAAPISRSRLLVEKYLALLTPVIVVNLVVFVAVYAAAAFVDEPLPLADLAAVHLLSVPYFLALAAFGMLASVAAPRRLFAEGVAAGAVVGAFPIQQVVRGTGVDWLGAVAPMRYYDPLTILTAGQYDIGGAAVLLAAAAVLLLASAWLFGRVDVR